MPVKKLISWSEAKVHWYLVAGGIINRVPNTFPWVSCLPISDAHWVSMLQVVDALDLARATMTKVHQNLSWAVAYNVVAIPIAAGLLLPHFDFAMTPSLSGDWYLIVAIIFIFMKMFMIPILVLEFFQSSKGWCYRNSMNNEIIHCLSQTRERSSVNNSNLVFLVDDINLYMYHISQDLW